MVLMPLGTPAIQPMTLADAKAHLRVTHDAEDALIAELIAAAGRFLTEDTGLALTHQDWRLSLSTTPTCPVALPRHPVASVITVTIYAADGTPTTLDGSAYRLDLMARPATLTLEQGAAPAGTDNMEIDFRAGFGATGLEVPDTLRRALLALVAHWYEFRAVYDASDQPVSVPMLYSRLVRSWRRIGI